MANASVIRRWMRKATRLLDNGDGSYSPLVGVAPGALVADAHGAVQSAAANTVIATSGALAAGDYRVEAEIASDDAAGAVKTATLRRVNAGGVVQRESRVPAPGYGGIVWSRVTLAANDRIEVQNALASAVGFFYYGHLRVYKLS
jgi:hypothetical protein